MQFASPTDSTHESYPSKRNNLSIGMTNQEPAHNPSTSAVPQTVTKSEAAVSATDVKSYRFEELAAGNALVRIELQGTTYTLRRTRAGGLILNK